MYSSGLQILTNKFNVRNMNCVSLQLIYGERFANGQKKILLYTKLCTNKKNTLNILLVQGLCPLLINI